MGVCHRTARKTDPAEDSVTRDEMVARNATEIAAESPLWRLTSWAVYRCRDFNSTS